jgi:hypothetical protein
LLFDFARVTLHLKKAREGFENMQENNVSMVNVPTEIKPVIEEIIKAYKEKRIKSIKYGNPSIWQIIDEQEPKSKKIYIQIIPAKAVK